MTDEEIAHEFGPNFLPAGSCFVYLGRECCVLRYAGYGEGINGGYHGMVYEYADASGVIHKRECQPRDYEAMMKAVGVLR